MGCGRNWWIFYDKEDVIEATIEDMSSHFSAEGTSAMSDVIWKHSSKEMYFRYIYYLLAIQCNDSVQYNAAQYEYGLSVVGGVKSNISASDI